MRGGSSNVTNDSLGGEKFTVGLLRCSFSTLNKALQMHPATLINKMLLSHVSECRNTAYVFHVHVGTVSQREGSHQPR